MLQWQNNLGVFRAAVCRWLDKGVSRAVAGRSVALTCDAPQDRRDLPGLQEEGRCNTQAQHEMCAIKKPKRAMQALFAVSTGVCGEIYNNEECKIQDKTHFDVLIYLDIAAMLFATIMLIVMGKWL